MNLKEVSIEQISERNFSLFSEDWTLITVGKKSDYNMMTASWGGLGILWRKPVAFIFVRPSRYTYEYLEKNELFSLNFFTEDYRKWLNLCGTKSGRDINKMKEVELTPIELDGTICFDEARLVFVCKKIYNDDIKPERFLSDDIESIYNGKNYHRQYIGEVLKIYKETD